ncbi:MAG TPA: hypothetical protein VFV38_46270 [Ktedonobacteraceae bacterium]|nr:hypothetical protein [Ktedonobacteraceae bacterium]
MEFIYGTRAFVHLGQFFDKGAGDGIRRNMGIQFPPHRLHHYHLHDLKRGKPEQVRTV